jgi:hypothetical protein
MNRTHAARTTALFLLVTAGFALLAALLMPNPASAAVVSGCGTSAQKASPRASRPGRSWTTSPPSSGTGPKRLRSGPRPPSTSTAAATDHPFTHRRSPAPPRESGAAACPGPVTLGACPPSMTRSRPRRTSGASGPGSAATRSRSTPPAAERASGGISRPARTAAAAGSSTSPLRAPARRSTPGTAARRRFYAVPARPPGVMWATISG